MNVYSRARAPHGGKLTDPYLAKEYVRHARHLAKTLRECPARIAHELVDDLIATTAGVDHDAFREPWRRA